MMILLTDLQKVAGGRTLIDIPSLQVAAGEIAALAGTVGSGWETLMELLTGRSRPSHGSLLLAGIDPLVDKKAFSRLVGVVFAEDNLYLRETALGNLKFYCRLNRLPDSRAEQVLAQAGLADQAAIPVEKLAPGLKRRLALGRALLHQPRVLLLAEPFSRCDEATLNLLSQVMKQQAEDGAAILILAEESYALSGVCTVIYRLEAGRIAEVVRPDSIARPDLPFTIPAKPEGKVVLVAPADILYVVAKDDRAYLKTSSELLPTQFTLAELEKRLAPSGFFRAHRGYLVNLQHVKEIIPYTRDSFSLRLKDPAASVIPLSKSAAAELRQLLGY